MTLEEVQRAIEILALNQAEIGMAVHSMLTSEPAVDRSDHHSKLVAAVETAVSDLQQLAERVLDIPDGR